MHTAALRRYITYTDVNWIEQSLELLKFKSVSKYCDLDYFNLIKWVR